MRLTHTEMHKAMANLLHTFADVSLRGQLVVYDNVNNLIGWMQSDCLKPGTSTTLPFL